MTVAQATPVPYKNSIQATIEKPGGTPVSWIRFQNTPMAKQECEKLFSTEKEAGKSFTVKVRVYSIFLCKENPPAPGDVIFIGASAHHRYNFFRWFCFSLSLFLLSLL